MAEDRRSDEYWAFRRSVLKRDGHKCQWPGCRKRTRLQVHHIVPWVSSASLRYHIGNGISLCVPHHNAIKNKESHFAEMFRTIIEKQKVAKPKVKPKPRKKL